MSKIVISGYYGYKNFGDETILSILVKHLKNNELTVISGDTEYTSKTYGVNAVRNFDLISVIKALKNCEVLISGGGSLLQDVTSLKSLIYYLAVISLAMIFSKKVIIFAQGIGPINNKFAQFVTKQLLKRCDYVSVRDEKSMNLLQKWGISSDLVCDPVYSLEINHNAKTDSIGIQLRDFPSVSLNLLQKLALFVNAKFSDKKIEIFVLQKSQDLAVSERFQNILKSINSKIKTEIVTDDILNRISQLEYMIGMRFHALLLAIKSGVKSCAINYDIKVEKLAQEAGIPCISMDASENFEHLYGLLISENSQNLIDFANLKSFDWDTVDKALQ